MDEQRFEEMLRRIMREELQQAREHSPLQVTESTRQEFLKGIKGDLTAFVANTLGVQISEIIVCHSADRIAATLMGEFEDYCNTTLKIIVSRQVQDAVAPYVRYIDQKMGQLDEEADWWKRTADESHGSFKDSRRPGDNDSSHSVPSLDHELLRAMFRDEVNRTLKVIVQEVWTELYGRWGLGYDAFKEDLEPLRTKTEDSSESMDDESVK